MHNEVNIPSKKWKCSILHKRCPFFSAEQTVRRWTPLGGLGLPAKIVAVFSDANGWSSFISFWPLLRNIKGDWDGRNLNLTRNSLMSPWSVRMVRWWKTTKWSWLAPVTNQPSTSLAGKECVERTEEYWLQNWVYALFLLATLYTSWTVWYALIFSKST